MQRIEMFEASSHLSKSLSPQVSENGDNSTEDSTLSVEESLKQRNFALKELVKTEESYVQDLSLIVNGYIAEIRNPESDISMPEDLKGGKERMVFGNVEAIYEWHKNIALKELQNCIENPSVLGAIIKKSERKLDNLYVVYCKNKPVSEHIVSKHMSFFMKICKKLKHTLSLCDLLIKPVQRITKYELLIKDILKHTIRAGLSDEAHELKKALDVMRIVPKAANDMLNVGRLQKFEGKITAQGILLLHGLLLCAESKKAQRRVSSMQKPKKLQVFLFEQIIIFSDIVGKKSPSPTYIYKSHIYVNKMTFEEVEDTGGKKFIIYCTDPNRTNRSFICIAPTPELHAEWVQIIKHQLEKQLDFARALSMW